MGTPQAIPPLPTGYTLDQQPPASGSSIPPLPSGYKLDSPTPSAPAPAPTTEPGYDSNPVIRGLQHMTDATVGTHTNQGVIEGATKGIPEMVQHPVESAKMLTDAAASAQQQPWNDAYAAWNDPNHPVEGKLRGMVHAAYGLIPFAGPMLNEAGKSFGRGDLAAGFGTTAGVGAGLLLGKKSPGTVAEEGTAGEMGTVGAGIGKPGTPAAPGTIPRGSIAQRMAQKVVGASPEKMAEVPQGEEFSRAQVVDAAKAHGVNLDVADATGNPVAKGVKSVSERTILGSGPFEKNTAQNLNALNDWGHSLLDTTDPRNLRREQVGSLAQSKLADHQKALNDEAGEIFDDLTKRNGAVTPDTSGTIQKTASQIVDTNSDYYQKHPELLSGATKRAWGIVNSLMPEAEPKAMPAKPEGFETFAKETPAPKPKAPDTWSDLHRLRSDLMNEYRSPDIVGSRAEGWLKQLVEQVDSAMTSEASNLPPGDKAKFRVANDIYTEMKNTYDNPQHPFYHAVRALDGTTAGNAIANLKPEYIRQLREAMGKDFGVVQRDQIARLLDPNGDGQFDLKNLPSRLTKQQAESLQTMLSPGQLKDLKLMSKTSQVLHASANPSRTSDVGVKAAELLNIAHNPPLGVATSAGSYGAARGMTSPRAVEYLAGQPKRGSVSKAMRP